MSRSVSNFRAVQAYTAGVDLTNKFGVAATLNSQGEATNVMTAGGAVFGVIVEPGPLGHVIGIVNEQGVKVPALCAGAIAAGAKVMVAADGRFVTHSGTNTVVGVANTAASAANDLITITFTGTM